MEHPLISTRSKYVLIALKRAAITGRHTRLIGKREIFHKLSCEESHQSLNIMPNVCGAKDKM